MRVAHQHEAYNQGLFHNVAINARSICLPLLLANDLKEMLMSVMHTILSESGTQTSEWLRVVTEAL